MATDLIYEKFLQTVADKGENRTFLNSNEDHAVSVLVKIFQTSQSTLRIFAGCLCEHVGNQPAYIIALSEFIERGGKLYILLNAFDENKAKVSNLYKRLAYYKSQGKPIFVKKTPARPYLTNDPEKKEVHFTVGDEKAYRIETDVEKRTAECNFNNPVLASDTALFFDSLFKRADTEEIDIIKLFNDGHQ